MFDAARTVPRTYAEAINNENCDEMRWCLQR